MNTSNLVNLALKGDNAARTELYNLTCDKAFSLALQMTKNKEEAGKLSLVVLLHSVEQVQGLLEIKAPRRCDVLRSRGRGRQRRRA